MTERLYYRDGELRAFDARVVRCDVGADGRARVILDRTAFYPTSGGQPFDVGHLGDANVLDVVDRDDGEIEHVVTRRLEAGTAVHAEIDWKRRFDHMQQHSGQHVLSAAFDRILGVPTVSFHLGALASTIDLGREVTPADIDRAEAEANRIVWDDRLVTTREVDGEEAARLPLRKESKRTGPIRVIDVADFDLSACGGTHVSRTGSIGVIAATGWERFKSGTRLTFVCGERALHSHRRLRDSVATVSRLLSAGASEIGPAIERLRDEARARERRLTDVGAELVAYRAVEWRAAAQTIGPFRGVIRADPTADGAAIKALAQAIVGADEKLVAVIAGSGTPTPVVAACSAGVALDAGALIRSLTTALGGRGGGRPELAQGGVDADADRVLATARRFLDESGAGSSAMADRPL